MKVCYDKDVLKTVTRMIEFYRAIDLVPSFENGEIISTNQLYMNPLARTTLLNSLISNMNQNNIYKELSNDDAYSMVVSDFVQFAPQEDATLKYDELLIVPIGDIKIELNKNK